MRVSPWAWFYTNPHICANTRTKNDFHISAPSDLDLCPLTSKHAALPQIDLPVSSYLGNRSSKFEHRIVYRLQVNSGQGTDRWTDRLMGGQIYRV